MVISRSYSKMFQAYIPSLNNLPFSNKQCLIHKQINLKTFCKYLQSYKWHRRVNQSCQQKFTNSRYGQATVGKNIKTNGACSPRFGLSLERAAIHCLALKEDSWDVILFPISQGVLYENPIYIQMWQDFFLVGVLYITTFSVLFQTTAKIFVALFQNIRISMLFYLFYNFVVS